MEYKVIFLSMKMQIVNYGPLMDEYVEWKLSTEVAGMIT